VDPEVKRLAGVEHGLLWVSALGVAVLLAVAACVVRYEAEPGPSVMDAGVGDAGPEALAPDATASCARAVPPARPSTEDGTANPNLRLQFAMVDLWLLPREGDPIAGYDIDGLCTCPDREACKAVVLPDAAPLRRPSRCDDQGGRDNRAYQQYLSLREVTTQFGEEHWARQMVTGQETSLIEVADYNGGKNDPQVSVAVAAGMRGRRATDAGPDAALKFDGDDQWDIRTTDVPQAAPLGDGGTCTSMLDDCATRSIDRNAYVRDGVLVARIDGVFPWPLGSVPWRMDMRQGYLVARLERQPSGHYTLEGGQVAGRISAKDYLNVYGRITVSPLTVPLCRSAFFAAIRDDLCQALDLPLDPGLDGKDAVCDALSTALKFRAVSVKLGSVATYPLDTTECPDVNLTCD